MIRRSILKAIFAAIVLFLFYLVVVGLISDWTFLKQQLSQFWYYIALLATGFGIQIGLYSYLKELHCSKMPKGALAASSTTSVLSMISCCAHYLVNILPIVGIAGFVSVVNKYQVQLFWVGLIFNLFGILYMYKQIRKFNRTYEN